jgi:hypothetical protein
MEVMKHFIYAALLATVTLACVFLPASCRKNEQSETAPAETAENKPVQQWYYFTADGYEPAVSPDQAPAVLLRPWTEAVRVSDSGTDTAGNAILLINRLGILSFTGSPAPVFMHDIRLFGTTTAGSLVFCDNNPYFTLYRSSFFNEQAEQSSGPKELSSYTDEEQNRPYLVRIDRTNTTFLPVLTYGDIEAPSGEVTGTCYNGTIWISSIKTTTADRTEFRYLSWQPAAPLETFPAATRKGKIMATGVTKDIYRTACSPIPFSRAPDRLKLLFQRIPQELSFSVTCRTPGGSSPRQYLHGSENTQTQASAIMSDTSTAAVFADGTVYISAQQQLAFRLPALPAGFSYTDFCISGSYLAAAWEESSFYRTGRSGFIVISLPGGGSSQ